MGIPVVFVCEDNSLAVHTGKPSRHGFGSIIEVVSQFDCVVASDDSNDVESICQTTRDAADEARRTVCPAFIRFGCYRYLEHVGINTDFHEGYRDESEFQRYFDEKDCLAIQRRRLIEGGLNEDEIAAVEQEIEDRVGRAVIRAQGLPDPSPDQLYSGVFSETH